MNRLINFRKNLKAKNLDGFIVTNPVNIFYLTNFRGISPTEREAILIVTTKMTTLICPKLYQVEALKLSSAKLKIKIADERNHMFDAVKQLLLKAKAVGFEETDLKFSEFRHFKKELKGKKLIAQKNLIEEMRAVKRDDEINKIERAQEVSQKAFLEIVKTIKAGQREAEIAEKLAKIIKNLGGEGLAFESIIASGRNAAVPHHITASKKIKKRTKTLRRIFYSFPSFAGAFSAVSTAAICARLTRILTLGATSKTAMASFKSITLP